MIASNILVTQVRMFAGSIGCAVEGVVLQSLDCWDCSFESRRGHGCFSVTNVRYGSLRQAESPVQRSPTECGVSECDHEPSTVRRTWPTGGLWRHGQKARIFNY
jgi:hypothetical protein